MARIHLSSVLLPVDVTSHQRWLLLIGVEKTVTKVVGDGSASPFLDPAWHNSHMWDLKEKRNSTGWSWLTFPRLCLWNIESAKSFPTGKESYLGVFWNDQLNSGVMLDLGFKTLLFFQRCWTFASPKQLGALGTEQLCYCAHVFALQGFLLSSSPVRQSRK